MINVGDILSTVGCSIPWGYLEYHGDIMMHVGYHEYREGVQYHEGNIHGTEHPHGTHDIPHMYHDIPHGTQILKDGIPHGTEHPHGTHDIPRVHHDMKTPTVLKICPTFIMISPMALNTPRYSRYPPTVLMISPTVLNTPHGTEHPHGTAHTYRVFIYRWSSHLLPVRRKNTLIWSSKNIVCSL